MTPLNSDKPLDDSNGIAEIESNKAMNANDPSPKTPWFLRFAPGAILRKNGLIAVLAITTLLTPTIIEQLEAQTSSTNSPSQNVAPPPRPTYTPSTNRVARPPTRTSRTNQVQTPSRRTTQPAAVPVPVVVVAKPILKKGAIVAGKWLVAVLAEYGVHTALDKVFQNNKDQEATATVEHSQWISNEHSNKAESQWLSYHNWTTMADMGPQDQPESAMGWNGPLHRSMTEDEAIDRLERKKCTIIEEIWAAYDPTTRPTVVYTGIIITAREDSYAQVKAARLAKLRSQFNQRNIRWHRKWNKNTLKWNVGSFEMFSDFNDPKPILKKLGTENAIDSDANYYEATATWEYRELNPNGTWGEWKNKRKKFSQETGDRIKSWRDHHFTHDFCKDNQEITEPAIYEGIRRFISRRPVYERRRRTGQMRRGGDYHWVRVGWEPVVAQEYQDLSGN